MSFNSQESVKNSNQVEISLENLSHNVYHQLLENYPQFENLSDKKEKEILLTTLTSSMRELLNNFEEYLESYYFEKLEQSKLKGKQKMSCLRK
ncbi:MAG: hypothetical protein ACFBSE_03910 [Prochloraceae cyanobacterium]